MVDASETGPAKTEGLWAFAVEFYGREGVAPLCLRLQDDHGLDVDIVIACLWHASRGGSVDEMRLESMVVAAAPARDRVRAIRELRRGVGLDRKQDSVWQATYERLLAAELAAERVEFEWIESVLRDAPRELASGADECARQAREALECYAMREGESERAGASLRQLLVTFRPHY